MPSINRSLWLNSLWTIVTVISCAAQDWPLWKSYATGFMDNQVRVIDHDAGDRTTSEGQAYVMFFALVANDRSRFDGLLHWTEVNLAYGDLSAHLPAWLWGQKPDHSWGVRDNNPAADADLWMAYTLLEAGKVWNEPRYANLGTALARRIASEEVGQIPNFGAVLLPAPKGFQHGDSFRLNASYVPLQLLVRLGHEFPDGPWQQIAANVPAILQGSAPHGFVTDWIDLKTGGKFTASSLGSYDAIRVYLWAGMLDPATPQCSSILKALPGMAHYLHSNQVPPAKVSEDGSVEDPKGPAGFSAALLPYLSALGEKDIENQQNSRLLSELNSETGLYGKPARYYDQNLALFALGFRDRRFWFDSQGALQLSWKQRTAG
jgi:endo-1,4-beta-D-glucanase Y